MLLVTREWIQDSLRRIHLLIPALVRWLVGARGDMVSAIRVRSLRPRAVGETAYALVVRGNGVDGEIAAFGKCVAWCLGWSWS